MSQWAEIRHQHLVEGVAKKQIARRLQLDIKTVRRAVEQPTPPVLASSPRVRSQAPGLAPGQKLPHGPSVRRLRAPVGDPRGEEFQEPRHRHGPRVDDQPRQHEQLGRRRARRAQGVRRLDPHDIFVHCLPSPPPPAASPSSTSASNCS